VLTLRGYRFLLGPAVTGESIQLREEISRLLEAGLFLTSDEAKVSAVAVASISRAYNLGIGESECITICQADAKLTLWSDDRRARTVASNLLGTNRVVGTADLLRACVEQNLFSPLEAYSAYELARSRGAFLPPLTQISFQIERAACDDTVEL